MSSDPSEFYAHGKEWAGIEAVMRFQSVKRWHMIDTTRQQTLAEHSANVALLARQIANTAPRMFFGDAALVADRALRHDVPEVFTGDIPTHTKRHLDGLTGVERMVTPPGMRMRDPSPVIDLLIKLCDLADGIRFIRLHGVGATAKHAQSGLDAQFNEKVATMTTREWPEEVQGHVRKAITFYAYEFS